VAGRWFSLGTRVFFTNKTDRHDITGKIVESGIKYYNSPVKLMNPVDSSPPLFHSAILFLFVQLIGGEK
jgi:hypothetical protein